MNTHEHPDHTGGNSALIAATGARDCWPMPMRGMPFRYRPGLAGRDIVRVGKPLSWRRWIHPGIRCASICLLSHTDEPALFSGDTLFNAGAGNCHHGGHPRQLYSTFHSNQPVCRRTR